MGKRSSLILIFFLTFHLSALDEKAKALRNEFTKLLEELPSPDFQLSSEAETFLETFDPAEAEKRAKAKQWTESEQVFVDLDAVVRERQYKFEGNEAEFHPEILQNPLKVLGIVSAEEIPARTETRIEICREPGEYERLFHQTLEVTFTESKKKVKCCQGHGPDIEEIKGKDNHAREKKVDKRMSHLRGVYQNDPNIQSFNVSTESHKYHADIIVTYKHKNDVDICDFYQEIASAGSITEKDEWKTDDFEALEAIQKNGNCRLVLMKTEEGPGEREIEGKKVKREVWSRKLLFQCAPDANSPCETLRKQGGQLIKKQCIEWDEGDCMLWEKTYDLSKSYPAQTNYTFAEGEKIWGLNGELRTDPDINDGKRLSHILALLQTLSDMPLKEEENILDLDKKAVFNGKSYKCRCNKTINELEDCCQKMTGIFDINGFLNPCNDKEFELKKLKDEGRCHEIGKHTKEGFLIDFRKRTYCCYPTKLLRIFNEQVRKQMNMGWGTAKKPNCRGFSLEEMEGKVDFETLDLSEAVNELKIDETKLMNEMGEKLRMALEHPETNDLFLKEPNVFQ